jgi:anaerobic magnesium-protoporphyrin IX monomethyl ester cyclase
MSPDVLFGQAYYLRFDPKLWAGRQPYPPLGCLYAAASTRAAGYDVALFDAMLAASEDEWVADLDRHRPRFAVIYEDSFNYLSKMCLLRMREAALAMAASAHDRGLTVIVAGSDASDHPDIYLDRAADLVVAGEGEATLVEALDVLAGRVDRRLDDVPGLRFRGTDGTLVRTRPREFIRDLDRLPRPAWDLVDLERYRAIWLRHHGYFSMNIVTTRGCPYHCNWCAKPIYGQRYTARSAADVAEEIAWLHRTYRPDHFWIADDIFGLKPGWIERFADEMARRDTKVPFKCLVRADGVTPTSARALAASGCRTAWVGAESGSQRILDAMEKGTRVEEIAAATRLLRAVGIEVGFFLQFGYPGETWSDIERTLQMVRDCRPDDIGVSVSYPLPGTPFFERVRAELGAKQNWLDSDDLAMLYRATYVPDFYRVLHRFVHAEFRMRRLGRTLARVLAPGGSRARAAREAAAGMWRALTIPWLRWRLASLARRQNDGPAPQPAPLLSRQAASIPSEQPQ